jgi:uncharacterized membrane protein YdjX (TVP38/TMEM64 family)
MERNILYSIRKYWASNLIPQVSLLALDEIILAGGSLGYTGVLIVTLLISLIVFVPIPYIPVLIIALLSDRFDPNLLAFASAIGITLGRTTIFLASYRGRSLIKKGNINSDDPFAIITRKIWIIRLLCSIFNSISAWWSLLYSWVFPNLLHGNLLWQPSLESL